MNGTSRSQKDSICVLSVLSSVLKTVLNRPRVPCKRCKGDRLFPRYRSSPSFKLDPRRTIHENALARGWGSSLRRLEIRGTWSLSMPANPSRHSGRDSACSPKSPRAFWSLARFSAEQKSTPRKISSRHSIDTIPLFPREDKNHQRLLYRTIDCAERERERERRISFSRISSEGFTS